MHPNPTDDSERKLVGDIEKYGWHAIFITAEPDIPGYGFTVGFFQSYDHPEIVISGLSHQVTHELFRLLSVPIMAGQRFQPGDETSDIANFVCRFITVEQSFYHEYLGFARWFYRGSGFPALQLVWPDPGEHFPWEQGYDIRYRQPLLGDDRRT